jgi:hypothetical protein
MLQHFCADYSIGAAVCQGYLGHVGDDFGVCCWVHVDRDPPKAGVLTGAKAAASLPVFTSKIDDNPIE